MKGKHESITILEKKELKLKKNVEESNKESLNGKH